jgi:hypothetical protein
MNSSISIHEQLMFECCLERQRAMSHQKLATGLHLDHYRLSRRLVATIDGFLIKFVKSR